MRAGYIDTLGLIDGPDTYPSAILTKLQIFQKATNVIQKMNFASCAA